MRMHIKEGHAPPIHTRKHGTSCKPQDSAIFAIFALSCVITFSFIFAIFILIFTIFAHRNNTRTITSEVNVNTYSRSRHRKGLQYTHTTRVPFASRAARAAAGSAAGGLAASHAATLPSRGTIRPPLLVGCVASVLVAMNTLDGHLWQGQGYHRKLVRVQGPRPAWHRA